MVSNTSDRAHIFDTVFWQVLPAHYDRIKTRWLKIAHLYHEASSALMTTDRETGTNSLNAELDMLENDIKEYREVVEGLDKQGIVGIYLLAGRQKWRAEQLMREDMDNIHKSLKEIEDKVREMRADIVYGFEEKEKGD